MSCFEKSNTRCMAMMCVFIVLPWCSALNAQDVIQKRTRDAILANEEQTKQLLAEAAFQEKQVAALDKVIAETNEKRDADVKAIEKIRNWRDFDDFVSG